MEKKILVLNLISFERRKGEDSLSREMKAERIELREKIKLKIKINTFERINETSIIIFFLNKFLLFSIFCFTIHMTNLTDK